LKKAIAIMTLALVAIGVYAFCDHCLPVHEPDPNLCTSIPGACGNGNDRAYQVVRDSHGNNVISQCVMFTGIYCGTY
jgi:hypothetical protein